MRGESDVEYLVVTSVEQEVLLVFLDARRAILSLCCRTSSRMIVQSSLSWMYFTCHTKTHTMKGFCFRLGEIYCKIEENICKKKKWQLDLLTLSAWSGGESLYSWSARSKTNSTSGCFICTSSMILRHSIFKKNQVICFHFEWLIRHTVCCVCVLPWVEAPQGCVPVWLWFERPRRTDCPSDPEASPAPSAGFQSPADAQAGPWTPEQKRRRVETLRKLWNRLHVIVISLDWVHI